MYCLIFFHWLSVQDSPTKKQIGIGLRSGGLYYLPFLYHPCSKPSFATLVSLTVPFALWHSRLGHLYIFELNAMKLVLSSYSFGNISVTDISDCFSLSFWETICITCTSLYVCDSSPIWLSLFRHLGPTPAHKNVFLFVMCFLLIILLNIHGCIWLKIDLHLFYIYAAFSTMMFTKFEKKNKIFRLDYGGRNICTSQKIWNFMVTQGTQV